MHFYLNGLPTREKKPRDYGITMVMDKGMSTREVENFLLITQPYVDMVKLGFGTSYVTPNLKEKIELYREHDIPVYFGGTLFEAFIARGQFDDYRQILDKYDLDLVEVSDGSIEIPHEEKCQYIETLSKQGLRVLSEVGSKDVEKIIAPYKWIRMMKAELEAGSWKLIAEARESGTVGIFRKSGEVRSGLIEEILTQIPKEKIIWEAPQKQQQVWFIKLLDSNVNLGNIAPSEVISLETIRLGLRGDTFEHFLNPDNCNG